MPYSIYKNIYSKNAKSIRTPIVILYKEQRYDGIALWDTGASMTHISHKVVDMMGLYSHRQSSTLSHHGEDQVDNYLISLMLPNNYFVDDLEVLVGDYTPLNVDVVIGLDIISLGEFKMDYTGESPVFTFTQLTDEENIIETKLF